MNAGLFVHSFVRGLVPLQRRTKAATSMIVSRSDGDTVVEICTRFEAWDYLASIVQCALRSPVWECGWVSVCPMSSVTVCWLCFLRQT